MNSFPSGPGLRCCGLCQRRPQAGGCLGSACLVRPPQPRTEAGARPDHRGLPLPGARILPTKRRLGLDAGFPASRQGALYGNPKPEPGSLGRRPGLGREARWRAGRRRSPESPLPRAVRRGREGSRVRGVAPGRPWERGAPRRAAPRGPVPSTEGPSSWRQCHPKSPRKGRFEAAPLTPEAPRGPWGGRSPPPRRPRRRKWGGAPSLIPAEAGATTAGGAAQTRAGPGGPSARLATAVPSGGAQAPGETGLGRAGLGARCLAALLPRSPSRPRHPGKPRGRRPRAGAGQRVADAPEAGPGATSAHPRPRGPAGAERPAASRAARRPGLVGRGGAGDGHLFWERCDPPQTLCSSRFIF